MANVCKLISSKNHISLKTIILGVMVVTSIAFSYSTVLAKEQISGLTMQVQAAFDGNFKYGEWLPIWVELENTSADLEAEIQIRITGGAGTMVFSAPVSLPSISRKRLPVYVLPNNFTRSLEVQLFSSKALVATTKIDVQPNISSSFFIGIVSPERGALALLNGIEIPGIERKKVIIDVSIDEIPDRFEALRPIDVLILNDTDTSALSSKQIIALETWVNRGGRLVIGGGPGAIRTTAGLPDSLFPAELSKTVDLDSIPSLSRYIEDAYPVRVPGPFVVSQIQPDSGRLLAEEDNIPILTEWFIGQGYVDFIALDLSVSPFDAWSGTTAFWEKLIKVGSEYPSWMPIDVSYRQQVANQMPYALSNLPILDLPSTQWLALLLGFYILLVGPVNYLFLRYKKSLHWAWITIPVITVIFSAGAFGLGYAMHGSDLFVNKIAIYELQPNGSVYINSYLGLFSPGQSSYEIEVEDNNLLSPMGPFYDPWFAPTSITGFTSSKEIVLSQSDPGYVSGLTIEQWSMQSFMVEGMVDDFGTITGSLILDTDSLIGTIRNESTHAIKDAVIIFNRSFQRLGDISAGEEIEVQLPLADRNQPQFGYSISYQIYDDLQAQANSPISTRELEVKRTILDSIFNWSPYKSSFKSISGTQGILSKDPVFIGWLDTAPPEVKIFGQTPAQQITAILVANLTYSLPDSDHIQLPVGLIPGSLIKMPSDGGTCGEPGTTAVYLYRGEAIFEFVLPTDWVSLDIENLKLAIWSDSGVFEPISLYEWNTGDWVNMLNISQGVNLVPNAASLVSSEGIIHVKISSQETAQGCYYLDMGLEGWRR